MNCELERFYNEPNYKYICFTTSLFYKKNYTKVSKNLKPYNVSKQKVKLFLESIIKFVKNLYNNKYPENSILRIYYDDSINSEPKLKNLIENLKKFNKVQLIRYKCKNILYNSESHQDLFGTLLRFHAIFDDKSPNMEYVVSIDADNKYTEKFIEIFEEFKKENLLVKAINNISQISFHSSDKIFNTSSDYFNFIYLLGGAFFLKRNNLFNIGVWNRYLQNIFKQTDLMNLFDYLDFKRFSFNCINEQTDVQSNSYRSFNYGADEIWINYVLKKILVDNNLQHLLGVYLTKDYKFTFLKNRLKIFLEYNNKKNKYNLDLFINDCKFLKEKTFDELLNYIDILNQKNANILFKNISNNEYLDRLYLQFNLKFIIKNFNDLKQKRNKYGYYELTFN